MIVTRFALPVRSPTPFIVPWTCVAPASTAASEFATPTPQSSWQWMPTGWPVQPGAHAGRRLRDLAGQGRAVRVAQDDALGAAGDRGPQAAQRVLAIVAPAVEEVLGVVDDALALRDEERDGLLDHREVVLAVDADDLLQVQTPGLAHDRADGREAVGQHPQGGIGVRRQVAAPGHPERRDLRGLELLAGEQAEELDLLRVRRREPGLDEVQAEPVEGVRHAQLLRCRQRQPLTLHPVAQGGVVELDHRTGEGTGTGSSHSR